MPVCLRCGGQVKETAKYCGFCGYPTKRQTRDQQTTSNKQAGNTVPPQLRTMEDLIAEINRMLAYFSKMQSTYDEYESYKTRLNDRKKAYAKEYRRSLYHEETTSELIESLSRGDSDSIAAVFFMLCILVFLAIVFILILIQWPYSLLIAIGCSFFCGLFGFLGVRFFIKGMRGTRTERAAYYQLENQVKSIQSNLMNYYKSYGYCIVRFEDSNPIILYNVREYLTSGKANTLEEALKMARRNKVANKI